MPCPVCGGSERRPISPGFWECTTNRIWERWVPAGPGGSMRPERSATVCGHRYQDGAQPESGPACECGTYAIGACGECGVPVCGDHSWLRADRRLCATHTLEVDQAEQDRVAAEKARRAEARRAEEQRLARAPHDAARRLLAKGVATQPFHLHGVPKPGWHVWSRVKSSYDDDASGALLADGRIFAFVVTDYTPPRGTWERVRLQRRQTETRRVLTGERRLYVNGFSLEQLERYLERRGA